MAYPLAYRTPARWGLLAARHPVELLIEQAHLEKKAAAAASSFLFRVAAEPGRLRELSRLAREELVHFERCLRLLQQRQLGFGPQAPSGYADRLKAAVSPHMPARLVDELLVAAVIEARSHERMTLLADALAPRDAELAAFYRELVEAEGRHAEIYLEHAIARSSVAVVDARWAAITAHEAGVLEQLPWSPRLHGGLVGAPAGFHDDVVPG